MIRKGRGDAREGSMVIEFAMLSFPFLFMIYAVLEVGLLFVIDATIENAMAETNRLIRTGQAHASGLSRDQFKEEVCNRMSVIARDCDDRLSLDVRVIPRFSDNDLPGPSGDTFPEEFQIGEAGDIVVIRAWYRQPLITPFVADALASHSNGQAVLQATAAFRNEPFGDTTP